MMIHISPKKVNNMSELTISAEFQHQGVRYEERYKSKGQFKKALTSKRDMFISLVDLKEMKVVRRDNLKDYLKE